MIMETVLKGELKNKRKVGGPRRGPKAAYAQEMRTKLWLFCAKNSRRRKMIFMAVGVLLNALLVISMNFTYSYYCCVIQLCI